MSTGAVIHGIYHQYQHFLDNSFFSVPSLLIAVGSIILFIAFFGCCGALRENYCMIITVSHKYINIMRYFLSIKWTHLEKKLCLLNCIFVNKLIKKKSVCKYLKFL